MGVMEEVTSHGLRQNTVWQIQDVKKLKLGGLSEDCRVSSGGSDERATERQRAHAVELATNMASKCGVSREGRAL